MKYRLTSFISKTIGRRDKFTINISTTVNTGENRLRAEVTPNAQGFPYRSSSVVND